VDGGKLLGVLLAQILVLERRADLSPFEPERGGPFCLCAAVTTVMSSRVNRLDIRVKLRRRHFTIV